MGGSQTPPLMDHRRRRGWTAPPLSRRQIQPWVAGSGRDSCTAHSPEYVQGTLGETVPAKSLLARAPGGPGTVPTELRGAVTQRPQPQEAKRNAEESRVERGSENGPGPREPVSRGTVVQGPHCAEVSSVHCPTTAGRRREGPVSGESEAMCTGCRMGAVRPLSKRVFGLPLPGPFTGAVLNQQLFVFGEVRTDLEDSTDCGCRFMRLLFAGETLQMDVLPDDLGLCCVQVPRGVVRGVVRIGLVKCKMYKIFFST